MNGTLALSSFALVAGGLLLTYHALTRRRPSLSVRLARVDTRRAAGGMVVLPPQPVAVPVWLARVTAYYARELRHAGDRKSLRLLLVHKALLAFAAPFVVLAPYAAATARPPSLLLVLLLAATGSFVPDLLLRQQGKRRREAIFLDLPEALSVLALALGTGQSLRRALELTAKDTHGPLGSELQRALTLARRERVSEREALVQVARETGEPTFVRFCELLAAKESPYLDFLRQQAKEMRGEQARYLERAADRAYLAMHAPLAPLLAVLVLLLAYGFLRFLAHTV
ncbi:MAG TPA: type II secretion system F family protein [Gaiellaceae bacterium]|nr:type II secretion system F family protein [Gaiellaceae bacterium]